MNHKRILTVILIKDKSLKTLFTSKASSASSLSSPSLIFLLGMSSISTFGSISDSFTLEWFLNFVKTGVAGFWLNSAMNSTSLSLSTSFVVTSGLKVLGDGWISSGFFGLLVETFDEGFFSLLGNGRFVFSAFEGWFVVGLALLFNK